MRFCLWSLLFLFAMCQTPLATKKYNEDITVHRQQYKSSFLNDHSPLTKEDLIHLDFYPPDESYQLTCSVQQINDTTEININTFDGKSKKYMRFARFDCDFKEKKISLTAYKSRKLALNPLYRDYLFVPFTDLTNGEETYGGGRYMDIRTGQIVDGKIQIDFNKAYNPYCAYSDEYSCPIPPSENHLEMNIKAGEKAYSGKKDLNH